jgi:CheY-like chemotaxis protein
MARTILVVDDNAAFRGMLKTMLKMRGYEPVVANTPAEGLKYAAIPAVEAVLVDYDIPGMNGLEFCCQLQAQNRASGRDLPVWIMTGALDPEVGKSAGEVGALLVVRKPFNTDAMCAMLEKEFAARKT